LPDTLVFNEGGWVAVQQMKENNEAAGGELIAPEPLSRRSEVSVEQVAACLSLDASDIRTDAHCPQVVSVGLPFLVVELASRDALRSCIPNPVAYRSTLPLDGAVSIYAYTTDVDEAARRRSLRSAVHSPRQVQRLLKRGQAFIAVAWVAIAGIKEPHLLRLRARGQARSPDARLPLRLTARVCSWSSGPAGGGSQVALSNFHRPASVS
jgi:trans-2,3-dihydro-3-hydroxyanthranilate isomerase